MRYLYSIIIVNYNAKDVIIDCLQSIFQTLKFNCYEVIVVDNNSNDGSFELISSEFPQVRILRNERNYGFGKANNIAASKSKGKYLLFLNPDTVVTTNAIENLIHFLDNKPSKTMVTGKVLDFDDGIQANCQKFPTLPQKFLDFALFRIKYVKNPYTESKKIPTWKEDEIQEVDWVSGCFFAIDKEAFVEVGMFNEDFFCGFEDVELCRRFHSKGGKIFYFPNSEIFHKVGGTRMSLEKQKERTSLMLTGCIQYFLKYKPKIEVQLFIWFLKAVWILELGMLKPLSLIPILPSKKIEEKIDLLSYLFHESARLMPKLEK